MERTDVTEVVNACDAGREGELIFRLVYGMAGCTKPLFRRWISSMEDSAIREGFQNLKPGAEYEALYQSALCRSKADWLIGINATRLFSVLDHRTLNIGRVQTPTLAMLVNRDSEISGFQKEKYHLVRLALDGVEAVGEKIFDLQEAEQIQAACHERQAVCVSQDNDKKAVKPPKLYDLTALPVGERGLFMLICCKLLCSAASPQVYETVTAVFECGGHHFTAKEKSIVAEGWKVFERLFRSSLKNKPD